MEHFLKESAESDDILGFQTQFKQALTEALNRKMLGEAEVDSWITTKTGKHIGLDDEKKAITTAGGTIKKGTKFSKAKSIKEDLEIDLDASDIAEFYCRKVLPDEIAEFCQDLDNREEVYKELENRDVSEEVLSAFLQEYPI